MANRKIAPIAMSAMLPPMVMDTNLLSPRAQPPAGVAARGKARPRGRAVRLPEAPLLPTLSSRTQAGARVPGRLRGRKLGTASPGNGGRRALPEVRAVEIKMVLYLPRDVASVPVSRQVLDSCLDTLGVAPDTREDIALALTEACANVIQHAGPGDEYEVLASARAGRCIIEVVNTGQGAAVVPPAEHGRGLKIMDAVVDNLRLTGTRDGTTVHFEKTLRYVPGAPGELLLSGGR